MPLEIKIHQLSCGFVLVDHLWQESLPLAISKARHPQPSDWKV